MTAADQELDRVVAWLRRNSSRLFAYATIAVCTWLHHAGYAAIAFVLTSFVLLYASDQVDILTAEHARHEHRSEADG